jgi:hypothetical protein
MRQRALLALAVLAIAAPSCGSEAAAPAAPATEAAPAAPTTEPTPASFEETRDAILAAVEDGDYDALRPLIEPDTFLSDFGFGEEPDPVARWKELGPKALQTMGVLLRTQGVVRETNEGTLHQWPSYDADSKPGDLTSEDRELLSTVLTNNELKQALTAEYGYIGPKLGILADGTWWFFILEPGP